MSGKPANNLVASIRQRLLNISKEMSEDPNLVFIRYVVERMLYRITRSTEQLLELHCFSVI